MFNISSLSTVNSYDHDFVYNIQQKLFSVLADVAKGSQTTFLSYHLLHQLKSYNLNLFIAAGFIDVLLEMAT